MAPSVTEGGLDSPLHSPKPDARVGELRIVVTARDRLTRPLRIINRRLQMASWWIDWQRFFFFRPRTAELLARIDRVWPDG